MNLFNSSKNPAKFIRSKRSRNLQSSPPRGFAEPQRERSESSLPTARRQEAATCAPIRWRHGSFQESPTSAASLETTRNESPRRGKRKTSLPPLVETRPNQRHTRKGTEEGYTHIRGRRRRRMTSGRRREGRGRAAGGARRRTCRGGSQKEKKKKKSERNEGLDARTQRTSRLRVEYHPRAWTEL
jgi:hypothetical protein